MELCFSQSAQGALRAAQHCGGKKKTGHSGLVFFYKKGEKPSRREIRRYRKQLEREEAERERRAVPLGNEPSDVLGLELALSVGDIAAPLTGDGPRREVLRRMHLDFPLPGADAARVEAGAEQNWRWAMEALEALKTRAAAGEAVRIWADHSPDGACGLLHAASVLAELDAKVILVPLPRWWERYDGAVVQWSSWGEVHHTESGHLLGGAEELTRPVLSMLSRRWTALRRENAPLRAVLSGRVVGVDEDFYDPLLLRLLTAEPQGVGSAVGWFMALELGVGDWLLLRRLRALEEAGAVRITEEDGGRRGFYGAKIRLA